MAGMITPPSRPAANRIIVMFESWRVINKAERLSEVILRSSRNRNADASQTSLLAETSIKS